MKTNGTREIDLDLIECNHCSYYHKTYSWVGGELPRGKIVKGNDTYYTGHLSMTRIAGYIVEDCQICGATGYISVCCDNKLELE